MHRFSLCTKLVLEFIYSVKESFIYCLFTVESLFEGFILMFLLFLIQFNEFSYFLKLISSVFY